MNTYQLGLLVAYTVLVFGMGIWRGMRLQRELDEERSQ